MKENDCKYLKNKIRITFFFFFCFLGLNGQIGFYLTNPVHYNSGKVEILNNLKHTTSLTSLKIDSLGALYTFVKYKRPEIDSAYIKFVKDNFSNIQIFFSDSCAYYQLKCFLLENFKRRNHFLKKLQRRRYHQPGTKLSVGNNDYRFVLMEMHVEGYSRYSFFVESRKYRIY